MNSPLLLDTCAAIWIADDQPIAREAADMMDRTIADNEPIYVSPITGWELGLLVSRGRMNLLMSPQRWFERLLQAPGLQLGQDASRPLDILVLAAWNTATRSGGPHHRRDGARIWLSAYYA